MWKRNSANQGWAEALPETLTSKNLCETVSEKVQLSGGEGLVGRKDHLVWAEHSSALQHP